VLLSLDPLPGAFAICRLEPDASLPAWAAGGPLWSVTRTATELSVVCGLANVPADVRGDGPWRALMVRGPLDLTLTGVLASLAAPLASAGIGLLAVSTYDTDYLLVREADLDRAVRTLQQAGHRIG